MPTTFAQVVEDKSLDADTLAAIAGVEADEAAGWITAGDVPTEHVTALEEALEVSLASNGNGNGQSAAKPKKKAASKSKSRGRRSSLSAEASHALRVAAELAHASEQHRAIIEEVAGVVHTPEDTDADRLVLAAEGVMSLNKTTTDALEELVELRSVTNPIRMAISLAKLDKRQLNELNRLARLFQGLGDGDLPADNEDAAMEVVEQVQTVTSAHSDLLDWVVKLQP